MSKPPREAPVNFPSVFAGITDVEKLSIEKLAVYCLTETCFALKEENRVLIMTAKQKLDEEKEEWLDLFKWLVKISVVILVFSLFPLYANEILEWIF